MATERDDEFNRIGEALHSIESYCVELEGEIAQFEETLDKVYDLANSTPEFSDDAVAMDSALTDISLLVNRTTVK